MTLNIEFIESNFDRFNRQYFNNELVKPAFEIMHTKSLLGQCKWKNVNGQRRNYRIRISDYFASPEKQYQNTILHEMIHLYIRQKGIKDTNRHHGAVFYSHADRINRDGWHISRTDSVEGLDLTSDEVFTYHLIAFRDELERYFLMAYNPKYKYDFQRRFSRYPNHYQDAVWFTSTDNKKYASLTQCRKSIRGRFITKNVYDSIAEENKMRIAG